MLIPFWFVTFGSGGGLRKRGVIAGLVLAACVGTPTPSRAQQGLSHAEDPVLSQRLKRIDQDKLLKGGESGQTEFQVNLKLGPTPPSPVNLMQAEKPEFFQLSRTWGADSTVPPWGANRS